MMSEESERQAKPKMLTSAEAFDLWLHRPFEGVREGDSERQITLYAEAVQREFMRINGAALAATPSQGDALDAKRLATERDAWKWGYEYLQSRMESLGRHGWAHDCDGEIEARILAASSAPAHLSMCSSLDDTMQGYPNCDCAAIAAMGSTKEQPE
jgi:hypothetical protein